jgi:hypothetical protein
MSECLPFLADSAIFQNSLKFARLFLSGIFSLYLPGLFHRVSALFCLFGVDSFHTVNDWFLGIHCQTLLFSIMVYLLYFLYSRFLFLSFSRSIEIILES